MRMQNDSSGAIKERVTTVEGDIRRRELAGAKAWRLRSRIHWLAEGEAPSHYFFAQLKAKYARETIQFLRDQEGRDTRQEDEIKKQVTEYFQEQFRCAEPEVEDLQLRREVLELLDKKATAEQNQSLVVRAFLWGLNNEGKEKTSLVGWEIIGRPKLEGGLGLGNFNRQADVMKMRLLTRIMQGDAAEWITLLTTAIKKQARNWDDSRVNPFPLQEFLLLGPQPSAKTVKTARWLLSGWYKARKLLKFDPRNAQIPGQLEMWKVELLMRKSLVPVQLEWRKIRGIFSQCEVRRVDDFVNRDGKRRILPGLDRLAAEKDEETRRSLTQLEEWLLHTKPGEGRLENSSGWCWENDRIKTTAWAASNAQWRHLLSPMATPDPGMERKWPEGGSGTSWGNRWRALWKGPHLERNKLWVWRIFRHVFFTSARGAKMTVCESTCLRCGDDEEDIQHLFWSCNKVRNRWRELLNSGALGSSYSGVRVENVRLLSILDESLEKQRTNPKLLLAVITETRAIWRERNDWIFRNKDSRIPLNEILKEVTGELSIIGEKRTSEILRRTIQSEVCQIAAAVDLLEWQHSSPPQAAHSMPIDKGVVEEPTVGNPETAEE
ncbi:hypothetical protein R1sor_002660 [Riccia sorocarpa]|uniref:Reverse transcriptase zinc-binding domain-containing protein n=1 Tax=Riccia sorocarpa TaxID=122646 RepID=A0ABD3H089_9MARC